MDMPGKALRFRRRGDPDPVDHLALFPSEAAVGPRTFPATAGRISTIADFPAESPRIHAAGGLPGPRTAAPADAGAVSTPWLLIGLVLLVPPLATLLLLRMPVQSVVSTRGHFAPDVTVGTTVQAHQPLNVEVAPARPPSALLGEAEAIEIPAPMDATPTLDPQPRIANITTRAQRSRHTEPVTSRTGAAANPTVLDIISIGENVPIATVPLQASNSSVDRSKFFGSVSVASQPAGAQVVIDGRPVGVTPFQSEVRAGSHVVRVELDGYSRWSASVQVITAQTLSLLATLQPAQPPD
jgi:PEGA domain